MYGLRLVVRRQNSKFVVINLSSNFAFISQSSQLAFGQSLAIVRIGSHSVRVQNWHSGNHQPDFDLAIIQS